MNRLRLASVLSTLWNRPTLLYGKGDVHERAFETLLQQFDPTREYIRHPFGRNRWPDFHVMLDTRPIAIELKTTQSNTVCMGGTWPHTDCIYLISHTHPERTIYMNSEGVGDAQRITIVKGADLVTEEEQERYMRYREAVQQISRVRLPTLMVQPRTNLFVHLSMDKREEWYHRTLEWIVRFPDKK